ncbi:MFS transporter [Paenibacillus sp. FSL H8-0457]|uniref:MFS transporter n=1 Tax=Bacillales TaxID=1385 RepID=UPI0001788DA4|nr:MULTISPECIES: MFS transporter [Paenibacillus]ACX66963.1 major facilitator superfamily MFS_1 [Paenibacillus sp. Y412MC10]ETT68035.1 major facilitator superfamily protein [Paenibacillus sp. FSL H8-457]MCM3259431.1 MFS transporter [Paenibacillus lautus]
MTGSWKIYVLAIVSFLVGTSEYIISGVLDKIADSLGITITAAGQLITIFSLVYAILTPVLMALTAKVERRKLLVYSLGVFVVANLLSFALPGYIPFVIARVLMAMGAGMVVVTALGIAAKIAPPGKQASSIATVVMGFTASLIIGVPLGRVAAAAFGWKSVFGLIAVLGVISMLVLHKAIPKTTGDAPVPLLQQFALLKKPKVALGLAITFFWLGGYSVAYTYLSPYLLNVSGLNEQWISSALFAFGIASLIGSKFGGFSTDRWGVPLTLIGGMLLHIIALIVLTFTDAGASVMLVFAVLVIWSLAAWSSGPTQQYNLVQLEPNSSGVMLGLNQSMMQLSMAAGAGIGGIAIERISLSSIAWIGAAGVAIAAVVSLVLFQYIKQESTDHAALDA